MKLIIHAGMHKTGSTAIQEHFSKHAFEKVGYIPWAAANHSALFILLFQDHDAVAEYHGFKSLGPDFVSRLPELRSEWLKKTREFLSSFQGEFVIFSAEDISWPGFDNAVRRMLEFFQEYSDDITVIAYARESRSFAVSAYQQYLQGSDVVRLDPAILWPSYKARFQRLDDLLGRENVILRKYERGSLFRGNVVSDFAHQLSLEEVKAADTDQNQSLSAEATALLFVQRRHGSGFGAGDADSSAKNASFLRYLFATGGAAFDFSDSLWDPVEQEHADDLAWIENRLGQKFNRASNSEKIIISSEADLEQLAVVNAEWVRNALYDAIGQVDVRNPVDVAKLLDVLKSVSAL